MIFVLCTASTSTMAQGMARERTYGKNFPLTGFLLGCSDRKKVAMPMTNTSMRMRLFVLKGYASPKMPRLNRFAKMVMTAKKVVNSVFIKYIEEEFWMLLMTLLPSNTTLGMEAKLLSINTIWLTFLAASLPEATLTAQSASFMARISLTPSPVMATVLPNDLIALIRMAFCSGDTRPNTVYLLATDTTSLSFSPSSEIYWSASVTPTRRATSDTVTGLSPEMILTATSFSLNQRMVSAASSRILSDREMRASGFISAGSFSSRIGSGEKATRSTRSPEEAYWLTVRLSLSGRQSSTNSGAPMAMVPRSWKVTAESLRTDEKGSVTAGRRAALWPK